MGEREERETEIKVQRKKGRKISSPDSSIIVADGGSWGICLPRFDVGTFIQLRFPCHGVHLLFYYANELSSAVHFSRTFWKWV